MNKQKGFTIIELIVVIAIIAVLAGIVLIIVTQYINKSKNSAIEGNLATLLTNGAVYFDATPAGTGSGYKADTSGCLATGGVAQAITNAGSSLACQGDGSSQSWCASAATLAVGSTAGGYFCVDSTGYKALSTVAPACGAAHFTCQ